MSGALTPKQARFVAEYLIDLNATQAAIRAGYSAKTAYSIGNENLSKPEIAAAIAAGQGKVAAKLDITAEKVLRDLEDARTGAMKQGQFSAAIKAAELHGKHLGMFIERTENTTELTVRDVIDRPPNETREQWMRRREKEMARALGTTAGTAD